jgi:hypothetical protein
VLSNRLQAQLNTPVGVTPRVAFAALWAFPHDLGRMYAFVDVVNGRSRLPLSNDRCAAVSGHACVDTRTSAQADRTDMTFRVNRDRFSIFFGGHMNFLRAA